MGQEAEEPKAAEVGGEARRQAQDDERRRPLGEDDVLKQVHREEVELERLERCDGRREQECGAGGEAGDSPCGGGRAAQRQDVGGDQQRDAESGLGMS